MRVCIADGVKVDMIDVKTLLREVVKPVVLYKIHQADITVKNPNDTTVLKELLRTQQYRTIVGNIVETEVDSLVASLINFTTDFVEYMSLMDS